ncbi:MULTISPECIES: flavodoxin family protein [Clostridium]|uniref:Flavodoxin family protein n=1 Tax=Clostridium nitritogenes TaxID=83340 RepID=A0ABN1LRR3_9CLOT|nr:flavodoxin family protein [Clostridium baratii]KJU71668.1 NADPH-dependent FMN reductase [Clostridium baratii]MBS6042157.1 flavodoxin family protein [Clostridium baratii]MBT9831074.1 flavodoxin family protein [Clostridium baratii]MDY3207966.1 flavodoxin family protein [Clostridium baratii]
MKVIAINGSPRKNGNTSQALKIMADELEEQGIEVEIIQIGHLNIHGCIGCGYCRTSADNQCVFKDDIVNDVAKKMREADGFILASPTYYAGIAGTMKAFLDRVFYTSSKYFKYKVATSISVVRRAGGVDVVHQLNNYLNLAQTVMPPSQYWTIAYGLAKGEVIQDKEGIQTIRKNARSMAWLLNIIDAGKEKIPAPVDEDHVMTNFIR